AQVAFGTRGRHLRDTAAAAKNGAGAGPSADHDGGAFRTFRGAGSHRTRSGLEVAKRSSGSRKKTGGHTYGNARGTGASAVRDCGNRAERESREVSRRTGQRGDFPACRNGQSAIAHGTAGAVAARIRERLQSLPARRRGQRGEALRGRIELCEGQASARDERT